MPGVDLDRRPGVEPECSSALVRADREQRLDGEDVAPAGLTARDAVELAQLLERIDAHIGVRADADADAAMQEALDRDEAVAEVRLRRRACADTCARLAEEVELGAVGVRRMHHRRARAE